MPIYEYQCLACQRRVSLFFRSVFASGAETCSHCGSSQLRRLISGFAFRKSLATIWEESGPPDVPTMDYYKDPRNVGRWTEKRAQELGYELPTEVTDMISAAREGELPGPVKDL